MGIEAVPEPDGVRLDVPVPFALRKQREQSMAWVAGVSNGFPGLPLTLPDGRELGPSDVLSAPPSGVSGDRGQYYCHTKQ